MRIEDFDESIDWVGSPVLDDVRREVNCANAVVAHARFPRTR